MNVNTTRWEMWDEIAYDINLSFSLSHFLQIFTTLWWISVSLLRIYSFLWNANKTFVLGAFVNVARNVKTSNSPVTSHLNLHNTSNNALTAVKCQHIVCHKKNYMRNRDITKVSSLSSCYVGKVFFFCFVEELNNKVVGLKRMKTLKESSSYNLQ